MMMLLYPLRPTPLMLTLATSFMIWLFFTDIFSFLLALRFFPLVLMVLVYFKYLFVTLERAANGHVDPPILTLEFFQPFAEIRPYQLTMVLFFVASFSSWLWQLNLDYPATALVAFSVITLPAFIGLLGIRNGFFASLHPVTLIRFMYRIGLAYPAMLTLLAAGIGLLVIFFRSGWGLFTASFITAYSVVLVFLWIGRIIYSQRNNLDYHPDLSPEREAEKKEAALLLERKRRLARIYKERRRESALAVLLNYIEAEEDRLTAHAWYHREMMQWPQKRLAVRHGHYYARALREAGKHIIADLIEQECRNADPDAVKE